MFSPNIGANRTPTQPPPSRGRCRPALVIPSRLETILPVPVQKGRMRPVARRQRANHLAGVVDQALHAIAVIHVPRDDDVEIIAEANQPAIKHPMRRAGQRHAIVDDIGPNS